MFQKILYIIDSIEGARVSLPYTEEFKKAGTREIVVLALISQDGCGWTGRSLEECHQDQFEKERAKLELVLKEIENGSIKGKIRVEVGITAHSILKAAEEENFSLIVMGTGSGSVKGLLLGRTTSEVVRRAKVPVLVLH